jgi:hypothetical protein
MTRTSLLAKLTFLPAVVLVAAGLPAVPASAAPAPAEHTARSTVRQVEDSSFLFSYTFNGHLKVAGGNFTIGGEVYLAVKLNDGTVWFSTHVIAQPHSITPGGTLYVETTIAAPCAPGDNGYARAYDYATGVWSPRLPVAICRIID